VDWRDQLRWLIDAFARERVEKRDTGSAKRTRITTIVLTAVGFLGELRPFLAIALGLKARGHEVIVAASACYQEKVKLLRLGFRAIWPDSALVNDVARMRRFLDQRWGTIGRLREYVLPVLREF
jgi:UDP:flavonoid glycosyltransferase YjiC (YdhE family)